MSRWDYPPARPPRRPTPPLAATTEPAEPPLVEISERDWRRRQDAELARLRRIEEAARELADGLHQRGIAWCGAEQRALRDALGDGA